MDVQSVTESVQQLTELTAAGVALFTIVVNVGGRIITYYRARVRHVDQQHELLHVVAAPDDPEADVHGVSINIDTVVVIEAAA